MKLRQISTRGYFPIASANDVIRIANEHGARAYYEIERFLDTAPKKSIDENLAKRLLEDFGIKIHSDYVIPD